MPDLYDEKGRYRPTGLYTFEAFGFSRWALWRIAEGDAPDLERDYPLRAEDFGDEVSLALAERIAPEELARAERRPDFEQRRTVTRRKR